MSPRTNERLTDELREVIGPDRVRVPVDRPRTTEGDRPDLHSFGAFMTLNRLAMVMGACIVLVCAAIIALTTGDWWVLGVAAGAHALGTMTVALLSVRVTTTTERPSPTLAAAMSEEGVPSADGLFSEMVNEFREEPEPGTGEALAPDQNDRTVSVNEDPVKAGAEQAASLTPTGQPSKPVSAGGPPEFMIWSVGTAVAVGILCALIRLFIKQ